MTKADLYLERQIEECVPHLEARRRHYLRHSVAGIVLASLFGASFFALIVVGAILDKMAIAIPSVFGFLFITPIFVFMSVNAANRYKALFAKEVAPLFSTGLYERFLADTRRDVGELKKQMAAEMTKKPDDEAASYYEGAYRGVSFFTFGYGYVAPGKGHPRQAIGRYYEFTLPHSASVPVLVKNKQSLRIFAKKNLPLVVKTESTLFEENHQTTSTDEEKARLVLTPAVLMAVLDVENEYKGHASIFFNENKALLYLDDYEARFRLSVMKEVTVNLLNSYGEEVTLASKLVKAFGLNR